jgi:hypothetical protein
MGLDCASFRGLGVAMPDDRAWPNWGAGNVAAPVNEDLALRFENVIGERLREGGRGGRDLSLSNFLL